MEKKTNETIQSFKVGDKVRWKDDCRYTAIITDISNGRYAYQLYFNDEYRGSSVVMCSYLDSVVKDLTKLEKALR